MAFTEEETGIQRPGQGHQDIRAEPGWLQGLCPQASRVLWGPGEVAYHAWRGPQISSLSPASGEGTDAAP